MNTKLGILARKVELPKARFKREPYLLCLTGTGNGGEIEVKSQVFKGVRRGHPMNLNDFEVFPVGPTGGVLVSRVVVMESDAGYRRVGDLVGRGLEKLDKLPVASSFASGFPTPKLAGVGVLEALDTIVSVLKENQDDEMFAVDIKLEMGNSGWVLDDVDMPLKFQDGIWEFSRANRRVILSMALSQ